MTSAFVAPLKEATEFSATKKEEAAKIYLQTAKVKMTHDELMRVLNDPDLTFTLTPQGVMPYANFMHRVGMIKVKPETWKDVFVGDIGALPGN